MPPKKKGQSPTKATSKVKAKQTKQQKGGKAKVKTKAGGKVTPPPAQIGPVDVGGTQPPPLPNQPPVPLYDEQGNPVSTSPYPAEGGNKVGVATNQWGHSYAVYFDPQTGKWARLSGAKLSSYLEGRRRAFAASLGMTYEDYVATYVTPYLDEMAADGSVPGEPAAGGGGGGYDEDGNYVGPGGSYDENGNYVGGGGGGAGGGQTGPLSPAQNSALSYLKDMLAQFGLDSPGLIQLVTSLVSQGITDAQQVITEIRKHPEYLANPLFAANIERAKAGKGFMPESQVIAYGAEVRRLAKQYGFKEPPASYIGEAIKANKSMAEIEHLLQVQKQVEIMGPVFKGFVEQEMGIQLGDDDLFEIFDLERDTQDFDDAFRAASYRARPFTLGLGIRSEAEQRALEMLGVDPNEAFRRYEAVAQNRPRFERLAQIEGLMTQRLPDSFGDFMVGVDNGLLVRALVFNDPEALARLQDMTAREIGRFNTSQRVVSTASGQAVGLLSAAERQSYG